MPDEMATPSWGEEVKEGSGVRAIKGGVHSDHSFIPEGQVVRATGSMTVFIKNDGWLLLSVLIIKRAWGVVNPK